MHLDIKRRSVGGAAHGQDDVAARLAVERGNLAEAVAVGAQDLVADLDIGAVSRPAVIDVADENLAVDPFGYHSDAVIGDIAAIGVHALQRAPIVEAEDVEKLEVGRPIGRIARGVRGVQTGKQFVYCPVDRYRLATGGVGSFVENSVGSPVERGKLGWPVKIIVDDLDRALKERSLVWRQRPGRAGSGHNKGREDC